MSMGDNQPSLRGLEAVVTGGTDGIGRETAIALAKMGASVTILGRDKTKGDLVIDKCRAVGADNTRFVASDLSSRASILETAKTVLQFVPRINILVNNAGGYFASRRVNADGIEMTFGLNHLGYYTLTNLLLERIKASAPARIVNVSSRLHLSGAIDFDNLEMKRGYSGTKQYNNTKLANVLFSNALARRLNGTGVTSNALHPGFVASSFGHNNKNLMGMALWTAQKLFAISPVKGARTSIFLASSPDVAGVTGKYFDNCKDTAAHALSYDEALQDRLWAVSAKMTGIG
jgi:NAD(P)-dependent dehydrogenase (short-subunit alcohol dehydrogenase family)